MYQWFELGRKKKQTWQLGFEFGGDYIVKKMYKKRLIKSGHVYELYDYGIPQCKGFTKSKWQIEQMKITRKANDERRKEVQEKIKNQSGKMDKEELAQLIEELKEAEGEKIQRREDNLNATRRELRRVINSNPQLLKFVTLTFEHHEVDVAKAHKYFKNFIERLKYKYSNVEYVCVVEFTKIGRVHYHILMNLPYIKNKTLAEIWGNGFVKVNRIDRVDNVGAYVVKYMKKDVNDIRLSGKKCWFKSQGLNEPKEITDEKKIAQVLAKLEQHKTFEFEFENDFTGKTKYVQFNTKRKS